MRGTGRGLRLRALEVAHLGRQRVQRRPLRAQRVRAAGRAVEPLAGLVQLLLREVRLHLERALPATGKSRHEPRKAPQRDNEYVLLSY